MAFFVPYLVCLGFAILLGGIWLFTGLSFASRFLFPIKTPYAQRKASKCLSDYFLEAHRSSYVIHNGHAEERIRGRPASQGSGVLLVDSSSAVLTEGRDGFERVIGPDGIDEDPNSPTGLRSSTFFLHPSETIRRVVDLRPQLRSKLVRAQTRDGLTVHWELYVEFQIQPYEAAAFHPIRAPYPFEPNAVHRAVYSEAMLLKEQRRSEAEGAEQVSINEQEQVYNWNDAVINEGEDELRHILAEYTLDQLFASDQPDHAPQGEIERRLLEGLRKRIRPKGVAILGVNLGVLRAPKDVIAQRVKTWQAYWQRKRAELLAEGEAEKQRKREKVRALAQIEMIQSITQELYEQQDSPLQDVVTMRLIQALERMTREAQERSGILPEDIRRSVQVIREMLASPNGSQGDTSR